MRFGHTQNGIPINGMRTHTTWKSYPSQLDRHKMELLSKSVGHIQLDNDILLHGIYLSNQSEIINRTLPSPITTRTHQGF